MKFNFLKLKNKFKADLKKTKINSEDVTTDTKDVSDVDSSTTLQSTAFSVWYGVGLVIFVFLLINLSIFSFNKYEEYKLRMISLNEMIEKNELVDVKDELTPEENNDITEVDKVGDNGCDNPEYIYDPKIEWLDSESLDESQETHVRLSLGDVEYFKKLSGVSEEILSIKFLPNSKLVVYFSGKRIWDNLKELNPNFIKIYNLETKEITQVFEYAPTRVELVKLSIEFDRLSGYSVSDDEKIIAITTNAQVWIYDISSQKLEQAYSDDEYDKTYILQRPIFSQDKKDLLLNIGYYEGGGQAKFNIESKQYTKLPFGGYVESKNALGWYENKFLVLKSEVKNTDTVYSLCLSDLDGINLDCKLDLPEYPGGFEYSGNTAYYKLTETSKSKFTCENVVNKYSQSRNSIIEKIDLNTWTRDRLLSFDTTKTNKINQKFYISETRVVKVNGKEELVLNVWDNGVKKYGVYAGLGENQLYKTGF